jgi:uncharacterized protein
VSQNVEIVRQAHEAFNRPDLGVFDLDGFYRLADPDLVVDWSRSNGLEAGIYRGEAATRRFWNTFFEAFERVVVEPLEFVEHGECVVVPHHFHAWGRQGVEVDAHSTVVLTVRGGRIIEMRLYRHKAEALKAVGLAEQAVLQKNVELAELVIAAFNRRDIDAFVQPTTADFEWFPALGMAVEGDSFRGREGVEAYFKALDATWEEVRLVTEEVRDLGESVVWLGRIEGRGRGSGAAVEAPMGAVLAVRDGKVWRARSYLDHGEALRAAGE